MKDHSSIFPIEKMCKILKISRSAYYSWKKRKPTPRDIENDLLASKIRKIFFESRRTYGSPRITLALRRQGIRVSKKRVARIMREENLRSIIRKKFVVTTDSKHNYPVVGNLLKRNFVVNGTGKVWVSDLTYSVPVSLQGINAAARAYLKYTFVSMSCCEGI